MSAVIVVADVVLLWITARLSLQIIRRDALQRVTLSLSYNWHFVTCYFCSLSLRVLKPLNFIDAFNCHKQSYLLSDGISRHCKFISCREVILTNRKLVIRAFSHTRICYSRRSNEMHVLRRMAYGLSIGTKIDNLE